MTKLEEMVKWCTLNAARINGKHLSDYIGPVTKNVTYNDDKVTVNTSITDTDIDNYNNEQVTSIYCYT